MAMSKSGKNGRGPARANILDRSDVRKPLESGRSIRFSITGKVGTLKNPPEGGTPNAVLQTLMAATQLNGSHQSQTNNLHYALTDSDKPSSADQVTESVESGHLWQSLPA